MDKEPVWETASEKGCRFLFRARTLGWILAFLALSVPGAFLVIVYLLYALGYDDNLCNRLVTPLVDALRIIDLHWRGALVVFAVFLGKSISGLIDRSNLELAKIPLRKKMPPTAGVQVGNGEGA